MKPRDVSHLRRLAFSVAMRVLGHPAEAEDIAQGAIERLLRRAGAIEDPPAFVATLAARDSLTLLRNQANRRRTLETYGLPVPTTSALAASDARLDLSYGLLVLSFSLSPLARAVFVLREGFDLSFDEIGQSLERSPATCRKLLSRARRKLSQAASPETGKTEHLAELMEAISTGNVAAVTALLTRDIVLLSDGGGKAPAFGRPVTGRERIARFLAVSPSLLHQPLLSNIADTAMGPVLLVRSNEGPGLCVLADVRDGRICRLYALSDPDKLRLIDKEHA